jgi:cystathionine beta-lyase/cystathionine gamma-synthase
MPNDAFGRSATSRGFSTRAIRSGQDPCSATGATIPPVCQTATFTLADVGVTKGFDYSRTANPTRSALEAQLADLEGARFACAFASGMAACAGAASLLRAGDHVVATLDIYGGTHRLLTQVLPRWGITTTFVDMRDRDGVAAAVQPNPKMFWVETPTNPLLRLIDIAAINTIRHARAPQALIAVDNTFASPFFQKPLQFGADVIVHSTTKYLCGHSDVVGGVVITDFPDVHKEIAFHQNAVGAIPGPWDAYLTLRGVKTLALRMRAHESNAFEIGQFLRSRDDVEDVYYPGFEDHPGHDVARRQMTGFGGIVSFRVRGGAARARAIARRTKIFNLATSLGGVESLICSPAVMTHGSLTPQERGTLGVTDDLLRLSVGIEDVPDLLADLAEALDGVPLALATA